MRVLNQIHAQAGLKKLLKARFEADRALFQYIETYWPVGSWIYMEGLRGRNLRGIVQHLSLSGKHGPVIRVVLEGSNEIIQVPFYLLRASRDTPL